MTARVVGGFQVVDGEEADDKIISVLANDNIWSDAKDIADLPDAMIDRLQHYFATYKNMPDEQAVITIESIYGCAEAQNVIQAALDDYDEEFGRG